MFNGRQSSQGENLPERIGLLELTTATEPLYCNRDFGDAEDANLEVVGQARPPFLAFGREGLSRSPSSSREVGKK